MAGFTMKGYERHLVNTYFCDDCKAAGREHDVIDIPGPFTDRRSCWGEGLPTTMRKCTACGHTDGPWISADLVGGGY